MENIPLSPKPLPREFYLHPAAGILFSVLTCGLYNIYWNYRQFQAMNLLLGREEYKFLNWLLLSIVTCGLYHIYYEYRMGVDLNCYLKDNGRPVGDNLALIGLVLSCFGLTVLTDAVYQHELNKLCE
ncbi:MAG: DUF4234 domain-containing protein [Elusimicrobia bacterium]|nr:DUF4234 domain-containing protein [Elusimicrobiota bacterium]